MPALVIEKGNEDEYTVSNGYCDLYKDITEKGTSSYNCQCDAGYGPLYDSDIEKDADGNTNGKLCEIKISDDESEKCAPANYVSNGISTPVTGSKLLDVLDNNNIYKMAPEPVIDRVAIPQN